MSLLSLSGSPSLENQLEREVDELLRTSFVSRDANIIPSSESVALKGGAASLEAAFLYADLAKSSVIAQYANWDVAAKIFRAFLLGATRIIRRFGGEIKSFDGDRVMGIFFGDLQCTRATKAALAIQWFVFKVLEPKFKINFPSLYQSGIEALPVRYAVGLDVGKVHAVKGGVWGANDLVWIGKAPCVAAKLSDLREEYYTSFATVNFFSRLRSKEVLYGDNGEEMWQLVERIIGGEKLLIYRSSWWSTRGL